MEDELVLRTVHKMFVTCSFPMRPDVLAASDTCQHHATNAVVDGDWRRYRCERHRGMIDATRTGDTVTAVYVRRSDG